MIPLLDLYADYIDTVQWVSTSGSGSLTVLFCSTICHEAMCDGT
jgi:hypothetical protein